MKRNIIYIVFGLIVCSFEGFSQQIPLYTSSLINPCLENPAIAGQNTYSQLYLNYRKQWVGIEGAPESALLSVDWPLKDEKSGLGLVISSDVTNILGHTGLMCTYSHSVKFDDAQYLRLGLAIKLNHNTIYFDRVKAEDAYESVLFNYFESATGINGNFGAYYQLKGFGAGISAINLVNSKLQYSDNTDKKKLYFQYIPHYYIHANYTYAFNELIKVRPEVALRDIHGMPAQFEASVLASYQDKYSAGIIFRNKNSLGFLASFMFYEKLSVSYSYQSALGELSGFNNGTHEICLGYRFYTSHYKGQKPVDSEKIDQLLEFAQHQVDENKELQKNNDDLKIEQEQLRTEMKKSKEEIDQMKQKLAEEQSNFEKAREEDEIALEDIPEELLKNPDEPIYIIMGVFKVGYDAKQFQQMLRREHEINTEVLKRKNNQDYIVCVSRKYDNKDELQKEVTHLKRIARMYNNSADVWIYINK